MSDKPNKPNHYWKNLFIPASGGLLTKEAVLGYFHAKGKIPHPHQVQTDFKECLAKVDDSIPLYHLGKPGFISTASGLAVTSGLYFFFRDSKTHCVNDPQHQGTIETRQLER